MVNYSNNTLYESDTTHPNNSLFETIVDKIEVITPTNGCIVILHSRGRKYAMIAAHI